MECTVYNPQKGRLETLEVEFTQENATWFYSRASDGVTIIADPFSIIYPSSPVRKSSPCYFASNCSL